MCGCISVLGVLFFGCAIILAIVMGRWDIAPYYLPGLAIFSLLLYFFRDDRG